MGGAVSLEKISHGTVFQRRGFRLRAKGGVTNIWYALWPVMGGSGRVVCIQSPWKSSVKEREPLLCWVNMPGLGLDVFRHLIYFYATYATDIMALFSRWVSKGSICSVIVFIFFTRVVSVWPCMCGNAPSLIHVQVANRGWCHWLILLLSTLSLGAWSLAVFWGCHFS